MMRSGGITSSIVDFGDCDWWNGLFAENKRVKYGGQGGCVGRVVNAMIGVVILAGTCFVLYKASHEKLMGEGRLVISISFSASVSGLVVGFVDDFSWRICWEM